MPIPFYTENDKIVELQDDFGKEYLASIIDWISFNLLPGDVYLDRQLAQYVHDQLDITEVYTDAEILEYLMSRHTLEEIVNEIKNVPLSSMQVRDEN